jgi:hypothetical protein
MHSISRVKDFQQRVHMYSSAIYHHGAMLTPSRGTFPALRIEPSPFGLVSTHTGGPLSFRPSRPARSAHPRQSIFAGAKLSQVNSSQSVTASSGDTSQCGVCFCDGGQLATGRKGRCASALAPGVQPTPVSHAYPHRIGTDHLPGPECLEVLQEEGRCAPCSKDQQHAPPNAWPRSQRGERQAN